MTEKIHKWLRNPRLVFTDEQGTKTSGATIISPEDNNVTKEDVLGGMKYEEVKDLQQMIYHALKKNELQQLEINELRAEIEKLKNP
jgi:hypothetical protein